MPAQFIRISGTLPGDVTPLRETMQRVLNDPATTGLVIGLDCNGGPYSASLDLLTDSIWEWGRHGPKPIIALVYSEALSAGLQIACACPRIVMDPGARIGSLKSRATLGMDLTRNVAVAGDYELQPGEQMVEIDQQKAAEAARNAGFLQEAFIATIACYRGITEAEVVRRYGNGEVMTAAEALRRGAVDKIVPRAEFMKRMMSAE